MGAPVGPVVRANWIGIGPTTRERAARVLEQHLGAVWAAVLESHGYDPAQGWRLHLPGLDLVPGEAAAAPESNGRPPDAVG